MTAAASRPGEASRGAPGGAPRLAVDGRLADLTAAELDRLLRRAPADEPGVQAPVRSILEDVRARGDEALRELARRHDGVNLEGLEVPRKRWERALDGLDPGVRTALERAAANVRTFHAAQLPDVARSEPEPGVRLERRWSPVSRAGVYAPGGRAAYPSSVLMGVVPARVAGVDEVVVCSPPGPDGSPPAAVLAAAALAGADRVFALGGAGAVAALAFGTPTVPRCDAVVGPGNRWVTEAKRQVAGVVRIDAPAGPSEVLVVLEAAGEGVARLAASELVAQAEHDPDAAVALVTPSEEALAAVRAELAVQVAAAPRRETVEAALAAGGALLLADGLDEALAFADDYAAEHLVLLTRRPREDLERIRTAGTVFLGPASSVAFGDYLTGANHVLPTAGAGRSFSGLSVHDFLRSWTVQELTPDAARSLAADTARLAHAEGLPGHSAAARLRGA